MSTLVQSFAPKVYRLVLIPIDMYVYMGTIFRTQSLRPWLILLTYLKVEILTYSPRTGTWSKCLQNPWGVDLTLVPNHRRRLHDAAGFSFFTTRNRWIPTGITWCIRTHSLRTGVHDAVGFPFLPRQTNKYPRVLHTRVSFFPDHNIKGLLFFQPKKTGSISQKTHTGTPSENGTDPSVSSHMDALHSCRKLNL